MGAASSHNCCTNVQRTSSLSMCECTENLNHENELDLPKAVKLDPRSPTIGIYRTPIESLAFQQLPIRDKIKNRQMHLLQKQDNTAESECMDSDQSSLTQVTMQNTENSSCQGFVNFSYDGQSINNEYDTPKKTLHDPRSPTVDINRTPLEIKQGNDPKNDVMISNVSSMDPRSPSENVFRTPLSFMDDKIEESEQTDCSSFDPRSPLNDGVRTPISALTTGNLRRTVLVSNALMASPSSTFNVKSSAREDIGSFSESNRSSETIGGDCSEVSLVPNIPISPQASLSISLSSSNYDSESKDCSIDIDLFKNDTEFTISDLTNDIRNVNLLEKPQQVLEEKEVQPAMIQNTDDSSTQSPLKNVENIPDNLCYAECSHGNVDSKDSVEFTDTVKEKDDDELIAIEPKTEDDQTKQSDEPMSQEPKIKSTNNEIIITEQMLTENHNMLSSITVKKVESDNKLEPKTPCREVEQPNNNAPSPQADTLMNYRQNKSLIPKRRRSSSNDNRLSKSPVIITVSPNPGLKDRSQTSNKIYDEQNKPRSWSLSDASINASRNKKSKLPRQLSGPAGRKSILKSNLPGPPRSPLASLDNSIDRQERGRSRLNKRSKVPRYQGTPPNIVNKSLSVSRLSNSSQSSFISGKEN